MSIQLIAADLDGTILRSDKTVSARTEQAFRAVSAQGCLVVPSTGRLKKTIPEQVLGFPGVRFCVTSNGASVLDLQTGGAVFTDLMTREQTERVLSYLCPTGFLVEAYAGGNSYSERKALAGMIRMGPPEWLVDLTLQSQTFVDDLPAYVREHGMRLEKINLPYLPAGDRHRFACAFSSMPGFAVCSAYDTNLEINTASCSKGNALDHLCSRLGIPAAQAMAVGDGGNDVSMLRWAGLGVAMGNASRDALEAADAVTASNDADGVALALERYVLRPAGNPGL